MSTKNIIKLIEYPKEGILSKTIFKDSKVDITLFCMAPKTDMGEHTSSRQAIVQVIEGKGMFNLEGQDIVMEKGVIINMQKNALHSLRAEEKTSFLLILI
jgi:nitric oxide dioxygenase